MAGEQDMDQVQLTAKDGSSSAAQGEGETVSAPKVFKSDLL